ncbi:hypothetical protein [Spirosoma pollinicola]|uniref:DUF4382 domain-containing protein n=1 Tax=Spirosoma pollinicola TaxID=2057025 RepID=A0A2K8Z5R2_9BACT|nr:hypothetical protein [Spirosoma pollinicola]AUD05178.1 hypothetical protein CWM47_27040 [Spirosoma pollinicola]
MSRLLFVKLLILIGLTSSIIACSEKEPAANPVPVIAFKAINKVTLAANTTKAKRDSVVVAISFSDADGDLGEDPGDSTRLKRVFGNQTWGNYQIRAFQFVNNKFEEITPSVNKRLFVDLGGSTIVPQNGTLKYNQVFTYAGTYKLLPIKFQVRVRDRNLNESNVVETDTVSLPVSL